MIKNLIKGICEEHYEYCSQRNEHVIDNLKYLWFLYTKGSQKGLFKPFIFLAEINLLVNTGIISSEEGENMIRMFKSEDKENGVIAEQCLLSFRKERIEKLGQLSSDNFNYQNLNYAEDILPLKTFVRL